MAKIKDRGDVKRSQEGGGAGPGRCVWWEGEGVQPLGEEYVSFLVKCVLARQPPDFTAEHPPQGGENSRPHKNLYVRVQSLYL